MFRWTMTYCGILYLMLNSVNKQSPIAMSKKLVKTKKGNINIMKNEIVLYITDFLILPDWILVPLLSFFQCCAFSFILLWFHACAEFALFYQGE